MSALHRRILGLTATLGIALSAGLGCDSDLTDDPPPGQGGGGTGGNAGSGGTGGGTLAACQPLDELCYGGSGRTATSPGAECLATIDNTGAPRVQFRQTWNRSIKPLGNAEDIVYRTLKGRSQLDLPQCYMPGAGGYIQLFDWDRSNSDPAQQTMRVGYASYSSTPRARATPAAEVVRDGLCMIDWSYSLDPRLSPRPLAEFTPPADRWPEAKPQPWQIRPLTLTRRTSDFTIADVRDDVPEGSGVFYVDEATARMHLYYPLGYVTVLDSVAGGLGIPIREVEQFLQFNDTSFNCIGRFRADALDPNTNCDPGDNQANPAWGCKDDSVCPPPDLVPSGHTPVTGPGASPAFTRGYFLIVDLERVWSQTLGATLCVSYPREAVAQTEGWSNTSTWGKNCRGSSKWNPAAPGDTGLPNGDWCSKTNSPATADCHDAYLNESFSTAQAFKIKTETCGVVQ